MNEKKRKTRFVTIGGNGGNGVAVGFTELVLEPAEEENLVRLKFFLAGLEVRVMPKNSSGLYRIGQITDVRIVILASGEVIPYAVIKFEDLGVSKLRDLRDLVSGLPEVQRNFINEMTAASVNIDSDSYLMIKRK